jgi:hypothetical protein
VDFRERTRQSAAARLQGSKDSEHKKNDISFILNPIAMKFLRCVCKDIKHTVVEQHGQWSEGIMGTCMPTGRNAAAGQQGQ